MLKAGKGQRAKFAEEDASFRFERPGLLAVMEYVPGSVVIARGLRVTSRGILKHFTGVQDAGEVFGRRGWLAVCAAISTSRMYSSATIRRRAAHCVRSR